jgi:hypothetical protein
MKKKQRRKLKQQAGHCSIEELLNEVIPHDLEEITDALIEELKREEGMPEYDLKSMREAGFCYSRSRNSFFSEPVFEWNE